MMKRGRRIEASDPLELLLDTVSNVFGGIMFLTLLAILLIVDRGKSQLDLPEKAEPEKPTIEIAYEQLASKMDELDFALESQSRTLASVIPSEDAELQLKEFEQFEKEIAQLRNQVERASKELEDQMLQNEQLESSREDLEKQLNEKRAEVQAKIADLEKAREKAIRRVSFSLLREASTQEVVLLIRYGKLYRLTNSEDKNDVCTQDISVEGVYPDQTFQPRPEAGERISQHLFEKTLRFLRPYPPSSYHVTIAVWDDSFAEFNILRNVLVGSGYSFRTLICNKESVLGFGGNTGFVQ